MQRGQRSGLDRCPLHYLQHGDSSGGRRAPRAESVICQPTPVSPRPPAAHIPPGTVIAAGSGDVEHGGAHHPHADTTSIAPFPAVESEFEAFGVLGVTGRRTIGTG